MNERNDGGPAFPCATDQVLCSPNAAGPAKIQVVMRGGMSLRDFFAAKAMQVLLDIVAKSKDYANLPSGAPIGEMMGVKDVTEDAYAVADAMLRAREVKQ
jgi:hypothetical protein